MSFAAKTRARLARWIAPPPPPQQRKGGGMRMYHNARGGRLTAGFGTSPQGSADSELLTSLPILRARSRALVRDAPYAKRAKVVVINNVVGTGIGMQAQVKNQRGRLMDNVNDAIEREWADWCCAENCHTGGRLHFADLERQLMGQVFEAGEILVRMHPGYFGRSRVPLALEIVEPERLAEEYAKPDTNAVIYRMGIDQDEFGRPTGFWMRKRHRSELGLNNQSADLVYRVPAEQMFHLACVDRWPQTRGEPWLHAVARRLEDMDGLSEAEIVAARGAASYMGIRTLADPETLAEGATLPEATPEFEIEPGAVQTLNHGEEFNLIAPNRPNPNLDPFMRFMLREVAAGSHVSYESISGDYSQSNLSSSRMGQQDIRDDYRAIQQWFIRSFRQRLHHEWMQAAVLAGALPEIDLAAYALNPTKFEAVAFKPRGWSYINPKEDVEAAVIAIRSGLSTRTHEIARYGNGNDREDIDDMREQEIAAAAEKKLVYTSDPEMFANNGALHASSEPKPEAAASAPSPDDARVVPIRSNA